MVKIIRGIVEKVDDNGRCTVSPLGKRDNKFVWLENVKILSFTHNITTGSKIGRYCIVADMPLDKFILGFYTPDSDIDDQKVVVGTNEELFWAGKNRLISLEANGDIGIYKAFREKDGSVTKQSSLFRYDKINEKIKISSENIIIDMLGSSPGGNLSLEYDPITGSFGYLFEGKTALKDMSPRFKLRFSNPSVPSKVKGKMMDTDGIFELTVDNSKAPVRAIPTKILPVEAITVKMGAHDSTLSGLSLSVGEFCDITVGPKASDPEHLIEIKTVTGLEFKLTSTGIISMATGVASIEVTPTGDIEAKNQLGSITLGADGTITVKGIEFDIKTLQGTPGFNSIPICPFTGAPHTTNKVNPIG